MDRISIGQAFVAGMLMLAVSVPVSAQAETDSGEPLTMAEASAVALTHAMETAPSLVWPDEPAPTSLAASVPVARGYLWNNAIDHLLWPTHLRFVEARCNDDGAVALLFEEIRPLLPRRFAYAVRGSMPTSIDDAWAGGMGLSSVPDDPEFIRSMGSDTFACP